MTLAEVLQAATGAGRYGFLTVEELAVIVAEDRLRQVLVRCGLRRFACGAQYVADMIEAVEAVGDYIRDVSLPSSDPAFAGRFGAVTPVSTFSEGLQKCGISKGAADWFAQDTDQQPGGGICDDCCETVNEAGWFGNGFCNKCAIARGLYPEDLARADFGEPVDAHGRNYSDADSGL